MPGEGDRALILDKDSVKLSDIPLAIEPASVVRNIGGVGEPMAAQLGADIERWRDRARALLAPRAVLRRLPVTAVDATGVRLAGGYAFSGAKIGSLFRGAEHAVVGVCTIGEALEDEVARLFERAEYIDAMILDAIGTTAVEEIGMYARSLICRRYGDDEGLKVGPNLSPGYQYWDLRDQAVIFAIAPAADIGVSLNESYLMHPRKSESLVVPLGRQLKVTARVDEPPCRFCDRRDCPARVG